DFKINRFLRGMSFEPAIRHAVWLGAFDPWELDEVLVGPYESPWAEIGSVEQPGGDRTQQLIGLYVSTYLKDDILAKVDRASMACSLEVRAPFLDVELAEFLGRVPSRLKHRRLRSKVILKRAMADRLPEGIVQRPKKGFGIPIAAWLKRDLRSMLQDELASDR